MERAIPDGFNKVADTAKEVKVATDELAWSYNDMSDQPLIHGINVEEKKKRRTKNKAAKAARRKNR